MARDGERFLERTRHEFLEDLTSSFGERSDDFGAELKVLLFEFWIRARSRAPFPQHRPEPTDEMKQDEFEARLTTALANSSAARNTELRAEFVKSVQGSITVGEGITRNDQVTSLSLLLDSNHHLAGQVRFAQQLDECLVLDGVGLEKRLDPHAGEVWLELKLPANAVGAAIPEIDEFDLEPDDDQKRLTKRLEKLGLMPPGDWVPVFQHRDSGVRAGIDVTSNQHHFQRTVETLLFYDETTTNWKFPSPKPLYTYDDCPHVRLWVDGVEQMNGSCLWSESYDSSLFKQVVDDVCIPGATSCSSVRAVYTTLSTEHGP